jgi:hypothetical protein
MMSTRTGYEMCIFISRGPLWRERSKDVPITCMVNIVDRMALIMISNNLAMQPKEYYSMTSLPGRRLDGVSRFHDKACKKTFPLRHKLSAYRHTIAA